MRYDPDKGHEAKKWLALDEGERIDLVRRYHRRAGIKVPRLLVHSALHATVETQIAMGSALFVRHLMGCVGTGSAATMRFTRSRLFLRGR
ncbi:MAG: hypothetical protein ABIU86_02600 [Gemmatimonadaceae bacterium]